MALTDNEIIMGRINRTAKSKNRGRMREFFLMCLPHSSDKNQHTEHKTYSDPSFGTPLSMSFNTANTAKSTVSTLDPKSVRSMPPDSIIQKSGLALLASQPSTAQCSFQLEPNEYFEELGFMQFGCKTIAEAQLLALASGKPMLAIESRIPGDSDAGRDIFSHPLVVESCRSLFVSVARIIVEDEEHKSNNGSAAFARRTHSGKPCRTKVAFLNPHSGEFIGETLYGEKLTLACMVSAMINVLESWSPCSLVPKYLSLLYEEETGKVDPSFGSNQVSRVRDYTAFFATDDSASSEVEFSTLEGVFATRSVFIDGRRAVEISYDSKRIAYCSLVRHALKQDMATAIYYKTNDEKRAAEVEIARFEHLSASLEKFEGVVKADYGPKRALRKTPLRFVPMLDIQATRANRFVHLGRFDEAVHLLSPQQGTILMQAMRLTGQRLFQEVVDVPITTAWISVSERMYSSSVLAVHESEAQKLQEERKAETFEHRGSMFSILSI